MFRVEEPCRSGPQEAAGRRTFDREKRTQARERSCRCGGLLFLVAGGDLGGTSSSCSSRVCVFRLSSLIVCRAFLLPPWSQSRCCAECFQTLSVRFFCLRNVGAEKRVHCPVSLGLDAVTALLPVSFRGRRCFRAAPTRGGSALPSVPRPLPPALELKARTQCWW
ncbi:unnamed protein product [Scytosiphon promiscuus]